MGRDLPPADGLHARPAGQQVLVDDLGFQQVRLRRVAERLQPLTQAGDGLVVQALVALVYRQMHPAPGEVRLDGERPRQLPVRVVVTAEPQVESPRLSWGLHWSG